MAALIVTILILIGSVCAASLKALADSVSEFDFWWEDDNYDEL